MSIFKRLENHYKSKSYLTYHAANEHEQLLLFYPNYKSTKIYVIHKSDDSKWFKTAAIVSYKNNNLKSIFNDVIQKINKITIDEKALPQDKFRNPYVACLEYLSKYGYSIKTIEWE